MTVPHVCEHVSFEELFDSTRVVLLRRSGDAVGWVSPVRPRGVSQFLLHTRDKVAQPRARKVPSGGLPCMEQGQSLQGRTRGVPRKEPFSLGAALQCVGPAAAAMNV